ncbi:hypothetical protein [Yersinia massiliensis]|uniref:hypothetical protein n=2 Tax=Yersinia massiliensis TaxID=419257 RepID=UPI0021BD2D52|nr:hypothetical protein [Yersinia massiliensis]
MMSITDNCSLNTDKNITHQGKKIRSHIHRFNENNVAALSGYSVSINTSTQNWHSTKTTTLAVRKSATKQAVESEHISIVPKSGTSGKDSDITFYLPKKIGNYRAEISNFKPIKIAAQSKYSFDFKATSLPKDLILFQVRELGGSMKTLGGDRPPFSLHIKQDGTLVSTINTVNQHLVSADAESPLYQNENVVIEKIELGQYYHFELEMVMHRDQPLIKIAIDNNEVYRRDIPFGASDSKTFYSKLGAYVPQQKKAEGINDSQVSFDNIYEAHHEYPHSTLATENDVCLAHSATHHSLPDAMAAFTANQADMVSMAEQSAGKILQALATTIMTTPQLL